jgi:uncharacterized iron-regulated protein
MRIVATTICLCFAQPLLASPLAVEALAGLPVLHPKLDVVVVGEVHDNPDHHANQASIVAAFMPKAIVFEMLSAAQAARTPEDRSDEAALSAAYDWDDSGWPAFSMYYPIFAASPLSRIYGAAVPRADARLAVTEGAARVFGPGNTQWGLSTGLSPELLDKRMTDQFEAHCGSFAKDLLFGMVEAQRLRDAFLARAVAQALNDVGPPVVVIAGDGHASNDGGVPEMLRQGVPGVNVLSIGQFEDDPGPSAPFNYWIVTPSVKRADPCTMFR